MRQTLMVCLCNKPIITVLATILSYNWVSDQTFLAADHSRTMLTTPHSYPVSNHRSTVRLKNKLLNSDIYCSSRWRGLLASHLTAAALFYKAFLKPISSTLSSSKTANLLKFALIFLLLIAIQPCQGTHKISQKNSYPSKISNAIEMQPWFVKRVVMFTTT